MRSKHSDLTDPTNISAKAFKLGRVPCKGKSTQPVKVRPKEVSVHLGSYPEDGTGDQPIEAPGTEARRRAGQRAYGPQRE